LLQHGPPIALTDYRYLVTALAGALIAYVVRIEGHWWNRLWPVVGAGLVLVGRRRGWMLPEADAWSPARVVPARYRQRLRSARRAADRERDR